MPDKPTIREQWQAYRKTACEWCAAGCDGSFMRDGKHYAQLVNNEPFGGPAAPCTAMTFEAWAEWRIERLTEALKESREIITHSTIQCNHILDEEPDECGNVDDCVFHALLQNCDDALAAQPESGVTKYEPAK